MFQRYTEDARRSVFMARFEASQAGSGTIETEHLLLGILRTGSPVAIRLLGDQGRVEALLTQLHASSAPPPSKRSTDVPLSQECKRALTYANQESMALKHEHIDSGHLLFGLAQVEKCTAARLLAQYGITGARVHTELLQLTTERATRPAPVAARPVRSLLEDVRDLTRAAAEGALTPLIGREREMNSLGRVLARKSRNNPVLIGESGVGKTALVEGLAARIANGEAGPLFGEKRLLSMDAASLGDGKRGSLAATELSEVILCVEGLFDLAATGPGQGLSGAIAILEPLLTNGSVRCIATGTPAGLRLTVQRAPLLARHFEVIDVAAPSEEETASIVAGLKSRWEQFHGVVIDDSAIRAAVAASRRFLAHRQLPDRVLDLIDDAGARLKLRRSDGREIIEARKQVRAAVRKMEDAIGRHEFEAARGFSDDERRLRAELDRLVKERDAAGPADMRVTGETIEQVVAERVGAAPAAIHEILQQAEPAGLDVIRGALATVLPEREWVALLAEHLAGCTAEDAERLAHVILQSRRKTA